MSFWAWLGTGRQRTEALEREVADLREQLTAAGARIAGEGEIRRIVDDLSRRIAEVNDRTTVDMSVLRASVEASEREVKAVRSAVAMLTSQVPAEFERAQQLARRLDELEQAFSGVEQAARRDTDTVDELRRAAKSVEDALGALSGRITRLERQVQINADDVAKTATGLLERIEAARRADA